MIELNREFLIKTYENRNLFTLNKIYLGKNQITKIDFNTFKNLNYLTDLSLADNAIEELDVRLFEGLLILKELNLSKNKLKKIDSNTFKKLTKLNKLNLQNNEIEEIEVNLFEGLSNLKYLDLSENKLKRIDSNTFERLTYLISLSLNNNAIEEIDVRSFDTLSRLKELHLHSNKLKRIDANTFKNLKSLNKLELQHNEIEEIRLFKNLSNLEELYLYENKLKRIDSNTFKCLNKLEILELSYNNIEEIDVRAFEGLSNLKELRLDKNKLKEIDRKCFESLKSIEVIELHNNVGLNVLSFGFSWYEKSEYVSVWKKFLQQFPELKKQENSNNTSSPSSSSNNQPINKEENVNRFQDPNIGLFLNDRYKVVKKIGKGSFGSVYLVDDTKIDIKRVSEKAMKIMDKLDSVTENEIELCSKINHENIVRYFDHFHMSIEGESQTFLITEYCQNGDLKRQIEEAQNSDRNFDDRQLLDWIYQATNALKYLHSKTPDPIIHRDIKPANMLLTERNEIKLADLGLSKIMDNTHASTFAGSPAYMSPEVFKTQFIDVKYYPNTDIWSLGCVLYELKFLSIAFPRGQRADPPIPSNVFSSGIFSSVLPKMLEKDCLVRITSNRLLVELEGISRR